MKRLILVVSAVALSLVTVPPARAQADVSVSFFYDSLERGSWVELEPYGYCWQPDVAVNDPTWRPYADGYWAYTDDGWTWVSYEDFGWATYHYGRWTRLADYGWVWVPGQEWAPAWVSWRAGSNYIGWAPLPPETEGIYESRPLTGHLDIEFDIGPAFYNFVDVRYFGEPALSHRIVPVQQNVAYINETVNVTNITYQNKIVYNYGPDINVVNRFSSRPIQRLKLERQENVDLNVAAKSGGLTKVQGNALIVAAPLRVNKPAQPVAPPKVKAKLAQPKIEHGWSVAGDANAQNQLKERIKTQDLKNIPTPSAGGGAVTTGASPAGSMPSMATGTQFDRVTGRRAGASPRGSITPGTEFERGENKAKTGHLQTSGTVPPGASTEAPPIAGQPGEGRGKLRPEAKAQPAEGGQPPSNVPPHQGKQKKRENASPTPAPQ